MNAEQKKRRDELALIHFEQMQKLDEQAISNGNLSIEKRFGSFCYGYDAGFKDSEIHKASCCMDMELEIDELKRKYACLIRHSWMCAAISKAKAAELLGCSLINFDEKIAQALKEIEL